MQQLEHLSSVNARHINNFGPFTFGKFITK